MLDTSIQPSRPVVRYHGGKWLLAPWIISHFPEHRVYVEAFGGGASVLLQKERSELEVYNDLDGEMVSFFRTLRDPATAADLYERWALTPYSREEFNAAYSPTVDDVERARKILIRSWMSAGQVAVTRKSRSGFATDQMSVDRRSGVTETLIATAERFKSVVLENKPAAELITSLDAVDVLVYCDPPYLPETRTSFGGGVYRHEMTENEHCQLAEMLHTVKGMVVLSGYACDLYDRELYPTWHRVEREHRAGIAEKRTEVLWINPAAESRLNEKQQGLFA